MGKFVSLAEILAEIVLVMGNWELGIGNWALGIGHWALSASGQKPGFLPEYLVKTRRFGKNPVSLVLVRKFYF
jgi:hypothetical protein